MSAQLTSEEFDALKKLVFGSMASPADIDRWHRQGFVFCETAGLRFGLLQRNGGPCGVLSTVQAFIAARLLNMLPDEAAGIGRADSVVEYNAVDFPGAVDGEQCEAALVGALVAILFQAPPDEGDGKVRLIQRKALALGEDTETGQQTPAEAFEVLLFDSRAATRQRLEAMLPVLQSDFGVLTLVYSLALTRGVESCRREMDDPAGCFAGQFGHCNQELMNLLICGESTSQVHDGTVPLGDSGMNLRGVSRRPNVGYLSHLESLRYCHVGSFLKHPAWPLWVVGSDSHVTLLFATDPCVDARSAADELLERVQRAFKSADAQENGFIQVEALPRILTELKLEEHASPPERLQDLAARMEMQQGAGIILWSDFWRIISSLIGGSGPSSHSDVGAGAEAAGGALGEQKHMRQRSDSQIAREVVSRPRSDSQVARDLQAQWQAEDAVVANALPALESPGSTAGAPAATEEKTTSAAGSDHADFGAPWSCAVCTFLNLDGARTSCEMCGTPRQNLDQLGARSTGADLNLTAAAASATTAMAEPGATGSKRPRESDEQVSAAGYSTPGLDSATVDEAGGRTFDLWHYNGLLKLVNGEQRGPTLTRVTVTTVPSALAGASSGGHGNPIEEVIHTKWPGAALDWHGAALPSISS